MLRSRTAFQQGRQTIREEVPRSLGFEGVCWDCQHIVQMKDGSELGLGVVSKSGVCEVVGLDLMDLLDWRGLVSLLESAAVAVLRIVAEEEELEGLVIDVGTAEDFDSRGMFVSEVRGRW
jgi:hypothetical protein